MRVPFFGPSRTSAGFEPKKVGDVATPVPFVIVKLSERWWPLTRQPHVPFDPGVPKTVK